MTVRIDWDSGLLVGECVVKRRRTLADLAGYFDDRTALRNLPPDTVSYEVQSFEPIASLHRGQPLSGVCWSSDSDHDYETIARDRFASRPVRRDGLPTLVLQVPAAK